MGWNCWRKEQGCLRCRSWIRPESGRGIFPIPTDAGETAWGVSDGGELPLEAAGVAAEYAEGNTVARYPLPGGGMKTVFAADRIQVAVERTGAFVERVPVFDPWLRELRGAEDREGAGELAGAREEFFGGGAARKWAAGVRDSTVAISRRGR